VNILDRFLVKVVSITLHVLPAGGSRADMDWRTHKRTVRQTDMMKLMGSFYGFAKAP